jgi:predicted amidohydrolase
MLVDPMGTVRADLGPWPHVIVTELDRAMIAQVRTALPCLEHRRDDVFGPAEPAGMAATARRPAPRGP